jgi:ADP-heptose:LPS heptosyltransferase
VTRPLALVLRALYLGDLLTGLPALRMLRGTLPEYHLVLAAPVEFGRLAVAAGVVDAVTAAHELVPLRQPPLGADVAIDLHGNGPASRDLLAATRPRRLIAYAGGPYVWNAAEHEVTRWCRLVGAAFGVAPPWPGVRDQLPVPAEELPRGVTVIHPGAKAAARRWPAARFGEVARELRARGHDVVVTAGPGEDGLAHRVADADHAAMLAELTLPRLLALVAAARLVVCGDTGVAHVASAYGTPSVVLFGPTSPALWGPPADERHHVLWHGGEVAGGVGAGDPHGRGAGDPHAGRPDPALLAITVDEVVHAVDEVMARVSKQQRRGIRAANPSPQPQEVVGVD